METKLICIDDSIKLDAIISISAMYKQWAKKGETYTVREVLDNDGIVEGVLLNEIHNDPVHIHLLGREQEPAFGLFRFSTVVTDKVYNEINEEETITI